MVGTSGGEVDAGQAALAIVARAVHRLTGCVIEFDVKNAEAMAGPDYKEHDEEPGSSPWVRRKEVIDCVLFVAQLTDSMSDEDVVSCMKSIEADLGGDTKALDQMAREGGMNRAELVLPKDMESFLKIDEKERIKLVGECAALIDAFAGVPLEQNEVAEVELLLKSVKDISSTALEGCHCILSVTAKRMSRVSVDFARTSYGGAS